METLAAAMNISPTMTPKEEARRALAYHEAGHAVVAWSYRVRILYIKIEGLRGRVCDSIRQSQLHPESDYQKIVQLAAILWAGEAAEESLLDAGDVTSAEDDRSELDSTVEMLFPDSPQDARKWLSMTKDEARTRVIEHWARVVTCPGS
jgi:ATP-dependent Zn protease